jgi:predicted  nucleic acid-binding Zn-ribbon protein
MIADVQRDNEELKLLTQTAQNVIEDDKQQLAQINEDIAANRLQKEVAERQLAVIDANTEYLKEKMTEIRERQAEWQKVANAERKEGAQVDALDAEINRMQLQIVALETEVDQLYEQRTSIQLT